MTPSELHSRVTTPSSHGSPARRAKDQQVELIGFAQNIHMLNQEVHKNLRQNKSGIPLKSIGDLPRDYKRPPGFSLVPNLLGSNHHVLNLIKTNGKLHQSFDELTR
jgi:myosin III